MTVLTEEQKLKDAGAGRCALRHRSIRFLIPAILSFSKLPRLRLKLTDQAQWIRSVISEVKMLYVVSSSPKVGLENSDGTAISLLRAISDMLVYTLRSLRDCINRP